MRRVGVLWLGLLAAGALAAAARGAPAGFEPQSVTFVSLEQGWALGSAPCAAARCLALRETGDGGRSWSPAPLAPALVAAADRRFRGPEARYAIASLDVRFADARDGWIYGGVPASFRQSGLTYYGLRPALWSTHDGGRSWAQQRLPGVSAQDEIFDLEALRGTAWLMVTRYGGTVAVMSTPAGADRWTAAATPRLSLPAGGAQPSGRFVFANGAGWLVVGNDRGTSGSARLQRGRWAAWTPPCQAVGDSFTVPAAADALDLAAVCVIGGFASPLSRSAPPRATLGSSWLYLSRDGGASFHAGPELARRAIGEPAANGGPIASPALGTILLGRLEANGIDQQLVASFDGGVHWSVVATGTPVFLGFTSPAQGIAIMRARGGATSMLMTYDGGRRWAAVRF